MTPIKTFGMVRLTRDPELTASGDGLVICKFSGAVNEKTKSEDVAHFYNFVAFGKTAETIGRFFKKGSRILHNGKLKMSKWVDKGTGQNRTSYEIVIDEFNFVDPKSDQNDQQQNSPEPQNNNGFSDQVNQEASNDDIPF